MEESIHAPDSQPTLRSVLDAGQPIPKSYAILWKQNNILKKPQYALETKKKAISI